MFVIKRDGRKVQFEPRKITNAIFKAFSATGEGTLEDAKRLSRNVAKQIERKKLTPSVEEIQDRVELSLMRDGKYRTAKAYILYREQHKNIREIRGLMSDTTVVDDYLDKNDWMVK
ncbi:ribonucleoside triphosphate reductase, partial [Methanosarcinales archaeon]